MRTPHFRPKPSTWRETEVTGLLPRSCKIPIPANAFRKGSARMTEDFERPDWVQQMEPVLETVNEGVLIADDRRRVVFANSGFLRMTGLRAEDLVGYDIHSFYTAEEWAFLEKKIEESERVGHNRYEFTIPKKDGSRLPVIISAQAHENSDRRFGIVTFADISEQKLVQKQLREANQQLSEANEQLEERQKEI